MNNKKDTVSIQLSSPTFSHNLKIYAESWRDINLRFFLRNFKGTIYITVDKVNQNEMGHPGDE